MLYLLQSKKDSTHVLSGEMKPTDSGSLMVWPATMDDPEDRLLVVPETTPYKREPIMLQRRGADISILTQGITNHYVFKDAIYTAFDFIGDGETLSFDDLIERIRTSNTPASMRIDTEKLSKLPIMDESPRLALTSMGANPLIRWKSDTMHIPLYTLEQIVSAQKSGKIDAFDIVPASDFLQRHADLIKSHYYGISSSPKPLPVSVAAVAANIYDDGILEIDQKERELVKLIKDVGGISLSPMQIKQLMNDGPRELKILPLSLYELTRGFDPVDVAKHIAEHVKVNNTKSAYANAAFVINHAANNAPHPGAAITALTAGLRAGLGDLHPPYDTTTYYERIRSAYLSMYHPEPLVKPGLESLNIRTRNALAQEGFGTIHALNEIYQGENSLPMDAIKRLPNVGSFGYDQLSQWIKVQNGLNKLSDALHNVVSAGQNYHHQSDAARDFVGAIHAFCKKDAETDQVQTNEAVARAFSAVAVLPSEAHAGWLAHRAGHSSSITPKVAPDTSPRATLRHP